MITAILARRLNTEWVIALAAVGFFVAALLLLNTGLERECAAQFGDFTHRYSFLEGCMIQTPQGWVPDDNVRVVLQ